MIKKVVWMLLFFACLLFSLNSLAGSKGIYLTQYTLENTSLLNYLIKRSKSAGIDTFVVDLETPTKRYVNNIKILRDSGIRYIARITMFPGGGTPDMIDNPSIWQQKFSLVDKAVSLGASEIQLDYIRFNTKQKPTHKNAFRVFDIIAWYKEKLDARNIPLQIDVFGETSFGESKYIGQNIKLFSHSVDAICPMVYPSHYSPFPEHFRTPYETVYNSLNHIKKQFGDPMPMRVYAFIELSNYHYPMNHAKTLDYIRAQIKAVHDANADGWYAWSAHNRYDNLFSILENEQSMR